MVATSSQAEASLRRVAILLNHLDTENRRRLLAHFSTTEANQLRTAAARLSDVDPLEVRRVVTAFLGKVKASAATTTGEPRSSTPPPSASAANHPENATGDSADSKLSHSPAKQQLQFLTQVSDETLLMVICDEHPQTIAVVLGALPASQSARLIKHLSPEQRLQALRRLGRLDEIPIEILEDIASHLRKTVGEIEPILGREGHRTLVSIFSELEPTDRNSLIATLESSDAIVSKALQVAGQTQTGKESVVSPQTLPTGSAARPAPGWRAANFSGDSADREVTENAIFAESNRPDPRQANWTHPPAGNPSTPVDEPLTRGAEHATAETVPFQKGTDPSLTGFPISGETVDSLLAGLKPTQLQQVLARLSGHEAILAVAGLEPKVAKRLYRSLPRRRAKDIEKRIHSLGQVEMRAIEQAKESAIRIAIASNLVSWSEPTTSVWSSTVPRAA